MIYNPILIQNNEVDLVKIENLKAKYGKFVLMAGRLAPNKDQKTAILAIKYLHEEKRRSIHLL